MAKQILKISTLIIYIIYASLLFSQVYTSNQSNVYEESNPNSEIVLPKFEIILQGFLPAIVLLLFSVLLYSHLFLGQKKLTIFSSFFAASVLIINDPSGSLIAFALAVFGLAMAFLEFKRNA